jgi:hypothetical protein
MEAQAHSSDSFAHGLAVKESRKRGKMASARHTALGKRNDQEKDPRRTREKSKKKAMSMGKKKKGSRMAKMRSAKKRRGRSMPKISRAILSR